jgi:hypothetical protein
MVLVIIIAGAYLGTACYHLLSYMAEDSKESFYLHLIGCLIALGTLVSCALAYALEHKF